jgi:tRNA pseudouridine synthase 10
MNSQIDLELTKKTLHKYKLCDSCLGRLFKSVEKGITNKKRGELTRDILKHDKEIDSEECWLCQGLLNEIELFANLVSKEIRQYEFNTFLIGSKIDDDILEKEKELWDFTKSDSAEPIKMEINREVGKILEKKITKKSRF